MAGVSGSRQESLTVTGLEFRGMKALFVRPAPHGLDWRTHLCQRLNSMGIGVAQVVPCRLSHAMDLLGAVLGGRALVPRSCDDYGHCLLVILSGHRGAERLLKRCALVRSPCSGCGRGIYQSTWTISTWAGGRSTLLWPVVGFTSGVYEPTIWGKAASASLGLRT